MRRRFAASFNHRAGARFFPFHTDLFTLADTGAKFGCIYGDPSLALATRERLGTPKTETEWNSTTTPEEGEIVFVLASDKRGRYLIPFPVVFRDDSWWNARTGEKLETFIVGWRRIDDVE
jgi:hypothetical protein